MVKRQNPLLRRKFALRDEKRKRLPCEKVALQLGVYLFIHLFGRHLTYACERSRPRHHSSAIECFPRRQLNKNFPFPCTSLSFTCAVAEARTHFPTRRRTPHTPSARMQQRLDLGLADPITQEPLAEEQRALIWPIHATTRTHPSIRRRRRPPNPDPGNMCLQIGSFLHWNFFVRPHTDGPGWNVHTKARSAPLPNNRLLLSVCVCFVWAAKRTHMVTRCYAGRITHPFFLEPATLNQYKNLILEG